MMDEVMTSKCRRHLSPACPFNATVQRHQRAQQASLTLRAPTLTRPSITFCTPCSAPLRSLRAVDERGVKNPFSTPLNSRLNRFFGVGASHRTQAVSLPTFASLDSRESAHGTNLRCSAVYLGGSQIPGFHTPTSH